MAAKGYTRGGLTPERVGNNGRGGCPVRSGELTWPQRGRLWLRLGIRLAGAALGVLFLWKLAPPLLSLFMPFVLAFAAAALLNPLVRRLQRRLGWSRRLLSLLCLLVIFGLISTALGLLVRAAALELLSLAENWETMLDALRRVILELDLFLQDLFSHLPIHVNAPSQTLLDGLTDALSGWIRGAVADLGGLTAMLKDRAVGISSFVLALLMFLMGSYFISADYPYLRTRWMQHLDEGLLEFLRQVKSTAVAAFGGYLKAQLLLSVGVFFILLGGFLLTRQSYALLLALALAVLDFIPIVGSGTVMVPWAVIALFTREYDTAVSVILIWGAVALFRRVAEPKFVGNQTGLSPILSLVSIYAGMKLAGVPGMILGPIVTLVALNLLGLGVLEGTRADLRMAWADLRAILRRRD